MPILKRKPSASKLPVKGGVVKKMAKAAPPRKGVAVAKPKATRSTEKNEYGITVGTDQDLVLQEMLKGGADKHEVIERCTQMFEGQTTSGGKPKPVSTIVNQLIHKMGELGFTVESTWTLVPPADGVVIQKTRKTSAKRATSARPPIKKAGPPKVTRKLPVHKIRKAS